MAKLLLFVVLFVCLFFNHTGLFIHPVATAAVSFADTKAQFLRLFGFPLCTNKQFSRNLLGLWHRLWTTEACSWWTEEFLGS